MNKFIDRSTAIIPVVSKAATIFELLQELEVVLIKKRIPLCRQVNGKFYHPDVLTWFPDVKNQTTTMSPKMQLCTLPAGGMIEREIISEAKEIEMNYRHMIVDCIKAVIALVQDNHFTSMGMYNIAFLIETYKGKSTQIRFGLRSDDGTFYLSVRKGKGSRKCNAGCKLLLSKSI